MKNFIKKNKKILTALVTAIGVSLGAPAMLMNAGSPLIVNAFEEGVNTAMESMDF